MGQFLNEGHVNGDLFDTNLVLSLNISINALCELFLHTGIMYICTYLQTLKLCELKCMGIILTFLMHYDYNDTEYKYYTLNSF